MSRLRIFLLLVATIILPCNSIPDDIDDFTKISACFPLQNIDANIKYDKYKQDLEVKTSPVTIPPYLAQFLQQGNNLFFKPQILLGSNLHSVPYISHESDIKLEKEKQENGIVVSVTSTPIENDKVIKDNDKINKDNDKINKETDGVIEKIELPKSNEKLSELPEAPILAPLNMPALPQVLVEQPEEIIFEVPDSVMVGEPENAIVEEPENVIVEQALEPEVSIEKEHNIISPEAPALMPEPGNAIVEETPEVSIEKEHNIEIPEAPPLMPLNPPTAPLQIVVPKPVPHVPVCIPTIDNSGYQLAIPCFPNNVQPQYSGIVNFENISKNKEPSFPLPRIPIGGPFNRPVKTVMPFRANLVSTTRYLPSVTASKFPLNRRNYRLLKNHRRLSQMLFDKVPLQQQKAEVHEEPTSSFSTYCAHNIALQRILPNIANKDRIHAVPFLELPERPAYYL